MKDIFKKYIFIFAIILYSLFSIGQEEVDSLQKVGFSYKVDLGSGILVSNQSISYVFPSSFGIDPIEGNYIGISNATKFSMNTYFGSSRFKLGTSLSIFSALLDTLNSSNENFGSIDVHERVTLLYIGIPVDITILKRDRYTLRLNYQAKWSFSGEQELLSFPVKNKLVQSLGLPIVIKTKRTIGCIIQPEVQWNKMSTKKNTNGIEAKQSLNMWYAGLHLGIEMGRKVK